MTSKPAARACATIVLLSWALHPGPPRPSVGTSSLFRTGTRSLSCEPAEPSACGCTASTHPKGGQDFSNRSKQFLSDLVYGKVVQVEVRDIDRYGRTVGRVVVEGRDAGLELVRAGLAWHFAPIQVTGRLLAPSGKGGWPGGDCGFSEAPCHRGSFAAQHDHGRNCRSQPAR